ncbi:MAG: hypothetical protein ABIP48_27660 [Planctomycetota bacterium]
MATFTEDFTRMRQEFDDAFQERKEFVQGITANEAEARKERQEFVQGIRDDTAEMLEGHRQWMNETLKPFAADLKAGGEIFRGGPMA